MSRDAAVGEAVPGEIARSDLGPLTLSRVRAEPHAVQRSTRLINEEPRDEVLVSVQLRGNAVIRQDDRQAVLHPGDFAMYDATRPYDLIMREQFEMLVFQFDRQFLMERCPSPERLTAVRMSNNTTVTAPVSSFLRSMKPLALGNDNAVSRQLATSALDLLGVALADRFGGDGSPTAGRTKHFLRACTYINAYAYDPNLNPPRIASSIGVSLRYLHAIFKEHGMTVSEYLIKRRLARCMDELLSPMGRDPHDHRDRPQQRLQDVGPLLAPLRGGLRPVPERGQAQRPVRRPLIAAAFSWAPAPGQHCQPLSCLGHHPFDDDRRG